AVRAALRAPLPRIDIADAVIERIASGAAGPSAVQRAPWRHASRRALWFSGLVAAAAALLLTVLLNWQAAPSRSQGGSKPAPVATEFVEAERGQEQEKGLAKQGQEQEAQKEESQKKREGDGAAEELKVRQLEQHVAMKDAGQKDTAKGDREQHDADKGDGSGVIALNTVTADNTAATQRAADQPQLRAADLGAPGAAPAAPSAPAAAAQPVPPPAEKAPIVTAVTMLPQVMLQRRDGDAYAVPQGQTATMASAMAFFSQRSEADLATALPAATLQIRRLEALPPASTLEPMREKLR